MSLLFAWRDATTLSVDGSVLRSETFLESSAEQASRTRLALGNKTAELGELFRFVLGSGARLIGAGMKRGTLVLPTPPGTPDEQLMPTFSRAGRFPTPFLPRCFRQLAAWGFAVPQAVCQASLDRYNGDMAVGGRGEILAGRHGM
jgi:hypothetical protein